MFAFALFAALSAGQVSIGQDYVQVEIPELYFTEYMSGCTIVKNPEVYVVECTRESRVMFSTPEPLNVSMDLYWIFGPTFMWTVVDGRCQLRQVAEQSDGSNSYWYVCHPTQDAQP